ncbi:molybdenum cofactor biosynthesis protein [Candidatus Aerophobetes bacterium]|nr:molybdenum cofactor biosynthesis protein [Candidatus Aerophobetes bacterium]
MKPLKSLISLEEGKKILFSHIKPVEKVEKLPLTQANKRVLFRDVVASINVPPFNRAAMDGYAVKAHNIYSARSMEPVRLKLAGSISAGEFWEGELKDGECLQIATGAPVPSGVDAVVMVEDTEKDDGNFIKFYRPVYPGANISSAGEDIKKGQKVCLREDLLTPAKVGVLAALGEKEVEVFVKPLVAIIPSGDEIISPGEPLEKGKIYDVNSYTLLALVEENGCRVILKPKLTDNIDDIIKGIENALLADLIIITGGSSVGERDLILEAILQTKGEFLFHGIAVKPGKPTLACLVGEKLVLGMPGYPTSCLTNGYGFVVPLIRKLSHLPPKKEMLIKAPLSRRITSTLGRHQFLPVKLTNGWVVPVFKESGAITSMSEAEGYIEIPANVDLLERGDEVEVKLF